MPQEIANKADTFVKIGSAVLVAAALAGGAFGVYTHFAPRAYLHEYVDARFAHMDRIASVRRDIERIETQISKATNPDLIADLEASLETKREDLRQLTG